MSDAGVKKFLLGKDVTADGLPAHTAERTEEEVVVTLTSGVLHRHLGAEHDRRDGNGGGARWTVGSTYAVLPSGALAVTGWRVWSVGWPLGTNDSHSIVVTYAAHAWQSVTGYSEVDPYRDDARQRRREAEQKAASRVAAEATGA